MTWERYHAKAPASEPVQGRMRLRISICSRSRFCVLGALTRLDLESASRDRPAFRGSTRAEPLWLPDQGTIASTDGGLFPVEASPGNPILFLIVPGPIQRFPR